MFNSLSINHFFSLFQLFMPFELLRFDPQTYVPVRTVTGRCLRAQRGKPILFPEVWRSDIGQLHTPEPARVRRLSWEFCVVTGSRSFIWSCDAACQIQPSAFPLSVSLDPSGCCSDVHVSQRAQMWIRVRSPLRNDQISARTKNLSSVNPKLSCLLCPQEKQGYWWLHW